MTDAAMKAPLQPLRGKKCEIFSADNKFSTWRRLARARGKASRSWGWNITDEQLDEMRAHPTDIDYELAAAREHEVRHDVMAHIHTFGAACPKAMPNPSRRHVLLCRRQHGHHPHARGA